MAIQVARNIQSSGKTAWAPRYVLQPYAGAVAQHQVKTLEWLERT
jgi:hypothetical protein